MFSAICGGTRMLAIWRMARAGAIVATGCAGLSAAGATDHSEPMEEAEAIESPPALTCTYPVRADDTGASLMERFDIDAQLDQYPGESDDVYVVTLFGEDPVRTITVEFSDPERSSVVWVYGGPETVWTVAGLSVGSSIEAVEAANGGPFRMLGFEWDYHGQVIDYGEGALADLGGCQAVLALSYPYDLDSEVNYQPPVSLIGDVEIVSTDPDLLQSGAGVVTIGVQFGEDAAF